MRPASRSTYVVQPGDTLWRIAEAAYGDPHAAGAIARANQVPKTGLILVGQRLRLPALGGHDDHALGHHARHSQGQAAPYAAPAGEPAIEDALIWSAPSVIPGRRMAVPVGLKRDLSFLKSRAIGPGYEVEYQLKGELALIPKNGIGLAFDISRFADPELAWELEPRLRGAFALAGASASFRRGAGDSFDFSCAYTVASTVNNRPFQNLKAEVISPMQARLTLEPQPVKGELDGCEYEGTIGFEATITVVPPGRQFEPARIPAFAPASRAAAVRAAAAGLLVVIISVGGEIMELVEALGPDVIPVFAL